MCGRVLLNGLMREVVLLNSPEIGMHLVFFYACMEMCDAFKRMGYTVRIAPSISLLNNNCIVFLGNNFHVVNPVKLLVHQAPLAVYIGWYWNQHDVSQLPRFIHTYENKFKPRVPVSYFKSMTNPIKVPFLLRANEDPERIGTYPKPVVRHYCFMGHKYNSEMIPSSPKYTGYYFGTTNDSKYLNYETRKRIYLSSMFALGFQSRSNIEECHVSQRIYEGLAYGCVVLSNSPAAREQTNGIVELISSRREIEEKIDYYLKNPDAYNARQAAGYNFIKTLGGTNHSAAKLFIDAINTSFHESDEEVKSEGEVSCN